MRTEDVARLLPYLTPEERVQLDALVVGDKALFRPLPGPQAQAYHSAADITGYGGAAGGGKTMLACGLAVMEHERSIIIRREATQLTGIVDELTHMLGGRDGYNGSERIWRLPGRQIEFGSIPNPGDETKYQGRPHDLIVFDEAANLLEPPVRFLMGWLRTTNPKQRCRVVMTFNPPTTAEGRWLLKFFDAWLDPNHPRPAVPGELRWYATLDGEDIECWSGEPFDENGETITPLSRTFIPSRINDNPYLLRTGYMAQLQGLPEPLRSQMLRGDFMAGVEDDPWQVVPTAWIDQAQSRWRPPVGSPGPMDSMGVDVARGGRDETVIFRRHGAWMAEAVAIPGAETPDGPSALAQVLRVRRDKAPVHIDIIGVGSSPFDYLRTNDIQVLGINGSAKSLERSKEGTMSFANMRAEVTWRMREAIDPNGPNPLALPPDPKLRADLASYKWRLTSGGIQIESKDDILKRIGRSPDRGDAACLALISTVKDDFRRMGDARAADYDIFAALR